MPKIKDAPEWVNKAIEESPPLIITCEKCDAKINMSELKEFDVCLVLGCACIPCPNKCGNRLSNAIQKYLDYENDIIANAKRKLNK